MTFFYFSPTRRHKQVIHSVVAYFNEETPTIPYSTRQIEKTIEWLSYHKPDQNDLLKEKLYMAAKISAAHQQMPKSALL